MGALVVGGTKAYRTDLAASTRPKGYRAVEPALASRKRKGHCSWSAVRANRAAYVLSAFGAVGANNREAAAVDAAVNHQLCGKKWKVGGKATKKRLAMTGVSRGTQKAIKRRAKAMVRASASQAGPYALKVTTTPAAPGQPVTVKAKITAASGQAAVNRLVRLTVPTAFGTVDAYTNGAGEATWTFLMGTGSVNATVTAPSLEDYRLQVSRPKRKSAARVLLAGQTYAVAQTVRLTSKQQPTLSVSVAEARIPGGIPASFTYGSSLGNQSKKATVVLYGPFGSAASSSCSSGGMAATNRTVTGNGTTDISGWMPGVSGFYRIWVGVPEDSSNEPVSSCSSPLYLYGAQPYVAGVFPGNDTQNQATGSNFTSYFDYVGGYGSGGRYWHAILWGPFDSKSQSSCDAGEAKKRKQYAGWVTGDGRYNIATTSVARANAGWYRWGVTVGGDSANEAVAPFCGGAFQIFSFGG